MVHRRQPRRHGLRGIRIPWLGLLPRSLCAWSSALCRFNDWLGGLPGLRFVAYRLIIEAKGGSPAAAPSTRDTPAVPSQREDRANSSDGQPEQG
ncbi:MAG: hypothetical protein C4346_14005 [Chloroflexota bacterium]